MRVYLLFILGLLYSSAAISQNTETHLLNKFSQNEGLSSYNVRSIIQDPLGFTWIATQDGLNLFDGTTFVQYNYNMENDKKLLANDVRSLVLDSLHHLIWVLTNTGGINSIDYITGKVIDKIPITTVSNDDWNISLILSNNKLWLGCMNGVKVYNLPTHRWEKSPTIDFPKDNSDNLYSVRTLHKDSKGNIWVFINHYGIMVLDSATNGVIGELASNKIEVGGQDILFTSAANLINNEICVGTNAGLIKLGLNRGKITISKISSPSNFLLPNHSISSIFASRNNLYCCDNQHIYRFNRNFSSYTILSEFNSNYKDNWLNEIYCLYVDKSENLWIGCKQGLALLQSRSSPFQSFNNRNFPNSGLNHVYAVLPEKSGSILVGQERGLIKYNSKLGRFDSIEPNQSYNFLWQDKSGNTIVSSSIGLGVLRKNKLTPITATYPELGPVSKSYINSIEYLNDSTLVIGSDNDQGIYLWNIKKHQIRIINNKSYPIKLRSNIVNRVFIDHSKRIWVLSDRGIDIISADIKRISYLTISEPSSKNIFKLFFDIFQINNHYWVSTYGYGIIKIGDDGHLLEWLNTKNGLSNDGVYKLFQKDKNSFFITTNNGLSFYDARRGIFTNYYEQDGLHSNGFEEACGLIFDGKIYAGGLNGFSVINPSLLQFKKSPPVLYLNHVSIETKRGGIFIKNLKLKEVTIPSDVLQTNLFFSALNYSDPNRVNYQYKIKELNKEWIQLGRQNFINIIGISPGTYTIYVKASNEFGNLTPQPLAFQVLFLPKWYQTWLFKIVLLLLSLILMQLIYQYRINQIKIQQNIRREIAGDLHDDLGGTLNTIKIFAHMAAEENENVSYLEQIQQHIITATTGLRDMLWVLEDDKDNYREIINRILKYAVPIAEANQIQVNSEVGPTLENLSLSKTEKRNLLMIAKEAITNCLKYSACKNLWITLHYTNKRIILTIRDDGKGFEPELAIAGYGLNNMRFRANQIKFEIEIVSSPGTGTLIIIKKQQGKQPTVS